MAVSPLLCPSAVGRSPENVPVTFQGVKVVPWCVGECVLHDLVQMTEKTPVLPHNSSTEDRLENGVSEQKELRDVKGQRPRELT